VNTFLILIQFGYCCVYVLFIAKNAQLVSHNHLYFLVVLLATTYTHHLYSLVVLLAATYCISIFILFGSALCSTLSIFKLFSSACYSALCIIYILLGSVCYSFRAYQYFIIIFLMGKFF